MAELLEQRHCLSVFYDFEVMAQTGGELTSISPAASINDLGNVAFVASTADGQSVWMADGGAPQRVSSATPQSNITYGPEVQINDNNQVAAVSIISVGSQRRARIWDGNNPGNNEIIAASSTPRLLTDHFDSMGNFVSINNDGQLAFAGLESPLSGDAFWEVHLSDELVDRRDLFSLTSEVAEIPIPPGAFFRHMAADGGEVVVGNRQGGITEITLYGSSGPDVIASTDSGWAELGIRPGISDDGQIVTFYGNESSDADGDGITGPGIFASVDRAIGRSLIRIASLADGFSSFAIDQRVGVSDMNEEQRASFIVFLASDAAEEPKPGVFTSQLKFHFDPLTNLVITGFTASKPSKVILKGDVIPGLGTVNSLAIHDSVNSNGTAAFWADTSGGQAVVRTELPTQRVVLAWGHSANKKIEMITTAAGDQEFFVKAGTMPAFAVPAAEASLFDAYKKSVRDHVQQQFIDSGIDGIEVVNGDPERGATVVYFTYPLGSLGGIAYTGIDRLNRQSSDEVVVMVNGYLFLDAETDGEIVTHEVGHSLGLRHIDPPGAIEVMDYDRVFGEPEEFSSTPYFITEPPRAGGVVLGIDHNPVYHLKRYVEGATPTELESLGLTPGSWDTPGIVFSPLDWEFAFALTNGGSPADTTLHNVHLGVSDSGTDEFQLLAFYSSITLEDLSKQRFTLTEGQGVALFATSSASGQFDIALATGDPYQDNSLITFPNAGANSYFLQRFDSSPTGFSTLASVTVTATVQGDNQSPLAVDDLATTREGSSVAVSILNNDSDPDGTLDPTSLTITTSPVNGTATVQTERNLVNSDDDSSPAGNGVASSLSGQVDSAGNLELNVTGYDDFGFGGAHGEAGDYRLYVDFDDFDFNPANADLVFDRTLVPGLVDVFAESGLSPFASFVAWIDNTVGSGDPDTVLGHFESTTNLIYTPNLNFVGIDTIGYTVNDNDGGTSNQALVTIEVVENVPPVAGDDELTVNAGSGGPLPVLANDFDADGFLVEGSIVIVTSPAHGTAIVDPSAGTIDYTPDAGYQGPDTLAYTVQDDSGALSNQATVSILVVLGHAIIDNGVVQLGINKEGHLNVPGGPSSGGTTDVGLRYLETNAESTAPGCLCEGWGAGDATAGLSGYANVATDGGAQNLRLVSFTATASRAVSVVDIIGTDLRVTHDYHPTALTPNLYEVTVTIENRGTSEVSDLRYRRVMDWDIEPTPFSEFVTIQGFGVEPTLAFTSNNGFETANPLGARSSSGETGNFTDSGPNDHGALFDFELGALAAGAITSFNTYYGAAGNEAGALAAVDAVSATVYSFGQASVEGGPSTGAPNTFIFAFGNLREDAENDPPVPVDDVAATNRDQSLAISGAFLLANDQDADGDALALTAVAPVSEAGGTASLDPVTFAVTYTPPLGFSGTDRFTYTVSDGLDSASGTVIVSVVGAPRILDVRVQVGSQSISILEAGRTLPWLNIRAIDVVFSDDLLVDENDLLLDGVSSSFNYSSATRTASLSLASPLTLGRFTLRLDGDDLVSDANEGAKNIDGVFLEGGDFLLDLEVLPGDYNGDRVVTIQDSIGIRNHSAPYGPYDVWADLDGDGDVDADDINAPRRRLGARLP